MDSLLMAALVLVCTLTGAGIGLFLRDYLPEHHLSGESKDVIKQGFGLIATMVALVLGLLVASAKSQFDIQRTGFQQMSTNIIILDRLLAQYGPETKPARHILRQTVASTIEQLWPSGWWSRPLLDVGSQTITDEATLLIGKIRTLAPMNDYQRTIQTQALQISAELAKTRWSLSQPEGPLLPYPFLAVLIFWLGVLFLSFGLLTPRNSTVVATLLICAVSLAAAMFLIVDLGEPLSGLIRIPSSSLRYALSQLGR